MDIVYLIQHCLTNFGIISLQDTKRGSRANPSALQQLSYVGPGPSRRSPAPQRATTSRAGTIAEQNASLDLPKKTYPQKLTPNSMHPPISTPSRASLQKSSANKKQHLSTSQVCSSCLLLTYGTVKAPPQQPQQLTQASSRAPHPSPCHKGSPIPHLAKPSTKQKKPLRAPCTLEFTPYIPVT